MNMKNSCIRLRPTVVKSAAWIFPVPFVLAALMAGSPARALGLLESYKAALDQDPLFQGARSDQLAGDENVAIGMANLLPSVSASYGYNKNDGNRVALTNQTTEPLRYESKVATLSFRQPLFNLDGWQRYQGSQAQAAYSDARFAAARQDLIIRLATTYLEALLAEDQLQLAIVQRNAYKENYAANQHMYEKGAGTRTDVLETRARYQFAEAQVVGLLSNVTNKRNELAVIIGRDPGELATLAKHFPEMSLPPDSLEAWEALAIERNPEIQAQRYSVNYSRAEVERYRAGHYPRVDMVASHTISTSESPVSYNYQMNITSVGVQLSIPLYSGGSVNAQTRQASARLSSDMAGLDAATKKALVEVRKQFQSVASSRLRMQAMDEAEVSATEAVEATRKSVAGGQRVNLDVLTAIQQLYTTRRDLSEARHGYLLAHLRLRAAAGVLTEDDVIAVSACFQPQP
jgi:protease secretion system outer membrane protein